MKRYILFAYYKYLENGGADDLVGVFQTIEECKKRESRSDFDYSHIYDKEKDKIVLEKWGKNWVKREN